MAEMTPMLKQYMEVKERHPDCLLFFRLGDFYEMFFEDAKIAARELNLALTTRDRNKSKEEQTPMCGVPFHSCESYIGRLVAKGYKVAICEQMEDPATAKGLVKRAITRIVTPGTVTESSMLDEGRNNYLACVLAENGEIALCFCDISTGDFYATQTTSPEQALGELGRFAPAEALLSPEARELFAETLTDKLRCCVDPIGTEGFLPEDSLQAVLRLFGHLPGGPELVQHPFLCRCAGTLLRTLRETHRLPLSHIRQPEIYVSGQFLGLDLAARRNLELTETLAGERKGSLLWVLNKTRTAMGSRMLRSWLEKPLLSPKRIGQRLAAVDELVGLMVTRQELREYLDEVSDLERVLARVVTGSANGRDLLSMAAGCGPLRILRDSLRPMNSSLFAVLRTEIDDLSDLKDEILSTIREDAPLTLREGGMIRPGCNEELDRLHDILSGGKGTLARIEAEEKEKTGIKNLRVGYNRVFGYYIEVAKGQVSMVPETYIRKQTLTNGERYITPELKELESTILTAKDRIVALEYQIFTELRQWVAEQADRIRMTARAVACLDVLTTFAEVAAQNNYCRPEVDLSDVISIKEGRHPVVEQVLKDSLFVPNDTLLDGDLNRCSIITGPNMAGKSTYMRQVALITLMAQIGSFVPAKSARIGIVDQIFTRIGASDDLSGGRSTFMVEMSEVAEILRQGTNRSLLILDEIGRGTSTFDGMAIARGVLEYAADKKRMGAKTLFATHYHELSDIEHQISGVKNYNIAVRKRGGEIVFLRKIVPGAADRSYGVEVAKLAGLPDRVINRAREILKELEEGGAVRTVTVAAEDQLSITSLANDALRKKLEDLVVETLTPIEAMNLLYELKQML
ncbi:MAG: DNA mismatch repair protein MutS [Oscillospiraceae bacterium]|nr:DNA mismatch repair protein MutS [Oscillospiraceae bacterium]